jgi:hypothetical protein
MLNRRRRAYFILDLVLVLFASIPVPVAGGAKFAPDLCDSHFPQYGTSWHVSCGL